MVKLFLTFGLVARGALFTVTIVRQTWLLSVRQFPLISGIQQSRFLFAAFRTWLDHTIKASEFVVGLRRLLCSKVSSITLDPTDGKVAALPARHAIDTLSFDSRLFPHGRAELRLGFVLTTLTALAWVSMGAFVT